MSRRRLLTLAVFSPALLALHGCGFRLRGATTLPFDTLHIPPVPGSGLGGELARQINLSASTTTVADAGAADARLEVLRNHRSREILSLTTAGQVREYQLNQSVMFRVVDRTGLERLPPTTVSARRDYFFDDEQVIAKEQEEALLFRDMEDELVRQIMRRLAATGR